MRAITSLLTLALLSVLIGSCSEDITTPTQQQDDKQIRTYFISGSTDDDDPSNAPGIGGASKIKVNYDRLFFWQPGDHIWMYHDDDASTAQWVQDASSNVDEGKRGADFGFTQECRQNTYKVRYTGLINDKTANGQSEDEVVISANQTQDAPNVSDHIAYDGDCAVATATRIADENKFEFKLDHKAHILVFTPRVDRNEDPEMCYIKQIKITELDGKPLAGTYAFGDDGLDIPNVSNASSVVTLTPKTPGIFQLKKVKSVNDNACYVVIQPGQHRLKIEYEIGYGETWSVSWTGSAYSYTTAQEDVKTYTKYLPAGINEGASDSSVEPATGQVYSCNANDITRITHKLPYDGHNPEFSFEIPYAYYQWDARAWIFSEKEGHWNEDGSYVKNYLKGLNAESQTDGVDTQNKGYIPGEFESLHENWWYKWRCHRAGTDAGQYSCNDGLVASQDDDKISVDIPNANEMTWYIFNGDVHYDAETSWALKDFRGGEAAFRDGKAIFKGGLWILKKQYIDGFSSDHCVDIDGEQTEVNLTTTFPEEFTTSKYPNRFKKNPTKGRPDASVIERYFFLPLLGCFEVKKTSANAEYTAPAQYRFVAARAFYWTSTPYLWPGKTGYYDARSAYYFYYDMGYNYLCISASDHMSGGNNNRWQGYVANKRPEHWWLINDEASKQWFQ